MESSAYKGLFQEMEEESFINQWIMNSYDGLSATLPVSATAFTNNNHFQHSSHYDNHPLPLKSTTFYPNNHFLEDGLQNQMQRSSWGSCTNEPMPSPESHNIFSVSNNSNAVALSFFNPPSPPGQITLDRIDHQPAWNKDQSIYATTFDQQTNNNIRNMSASVRTPSAQDHVIAERKRRKKLSQKFIALTAVVPGLKKTDKASVLTDAIKCIKHLQERVKTLEDQTKVKTVESMVLGKKCKLLIDEKINPTAYGLDDELPEIEVRVCDKDVLIRVLCDNKKGVIEKVIGELSMLNLTISNTSALSFGISALNITIIARMDVKCRLSVKELATTMRARFMSFI